MFAAKSVVKEEVRQKQVTKEKANTFREQSINKSWSVYFVRFQITNRCSICFRQKRTFRLTEHRLRGKTFVNYFDIRASVETIIFRSSQKPFRLDIMNYAEVQRDDSVCRRTLTHFRILSRISIESKWGNYCHIFRLPSKHWSVRFICGHVLEINSAKDHAGLDGVGR